MQADSTIFPPPVPHMLGFAHVDGFPGYAVSYDFVRAYVWSCRGMGCKSWIEGNWRELSLNRNSRNSLHLKCQLTRRDGHYTKLVGHLMAESFLGRRPSGLVVCHGHAGAGCDLPSNLCWGTASKNSGEDRVRDGTSNRGERCGSAKLTQADVKEIYRLRAEGLQHKDIAPLFGVHKSTVGQILRGERWSHLGLHQERQSAHPSN